MTWGKFFLPHTVSVRALTSSGGMGSTYAAAAPFAAEVRDEQRLVRNKSGAQVVSSSQVTVPLDPMVPLGSLVTVWPGTSREREAEVLAVSANDNSDDVDLDSFLVLSLV